METAGSDLHRVTIEVAFGGVRGFAGRWVNKKIHSCASVYNQWILPFYIRLPYIARVLFRSSYSAYYLSFCLYKETFVDYAFLPFHVRPVICSTSISAVLVILINYVLQITHMRPGFIYMCCISISFVPRIIHHLCICPF